METLKQTGVQWIGEIPSAWNTIKLKYTAIGEDCLFLDGDWIESDVIEDEGIRYLTTGNVGAGFYKDQGAGYISQKTFDNLNCLKVFPGDIMISRLNEPIGRACFVPDGEEFYVVAVDNVILRPQNKYSKRYLVYAMNCIGYAENANLIARGATMQRISRSQLGQFWVPVPSFYEQESIADYLDTHCSQLDSIIKGLEDQLEKLKKYKKSLLYETVTKGLDKTAPLKDSGVKCIGSIPQHWKISKVKYIADESHPYPIGDGDHGMIKADDYLTEGIPYIRVLNLTWGNGLNMENLVFISDSMNAMIKNSTLRPNDILIAKTGATIGKTAIVPKSLPISNTTSHVGKITLPNTQNAEYFYYVMTSSVVQNQIEDISAMQSTRPELGIEGLKNLIVVVPPLEEQNDIAKYLDQRCREIDEVFSIKNEQLSAMKKHRDSIIFEYVTGKKRVKEVQ